MTLQVRYCGGCNPRYDRRAAVKKLEGLLPQIQLTGGYEGAGGLLLVCGCGASCISADDRQGRPVWYLSNETALEALATEISQSFAVNQSEKGRTS